MKKYVLFFVIALMAGSVAWSASSTGLTINATIAQRLDVSLDTTTWNITVDNSGTAIENASQGQLTVKSSRTSYTVTFLSANSGTLNNGAETIPYKIKVDTSGWAAGVATNNLSDYTQLNPSKTIVFKLRTPILGKIFPIGFKIEAYTDFFEDGVYTDTITISIAAN